MRITFYAADAYWEPCQKFERKLLTKVFIDFKSLAIFENSSISVGWQGFNTPVHLGVSHKMLQRPFFQITKPRDETERDCFVVLGLRNDESLKS